MVRRCLAALMFVAGFAPSVFAGSESVMVEGAWSRASIGVSRPGGAYMTIRNIGDEAVTLTDLRSDLALVAEIHETSLNAAGVSSMVPVDAIEIGPGESVSLAPGGLHVMLMRLQRSMVEGESFSLTLIFSDGGELTVIVPILGIAARGFES